MKILKELKWNSIFTSIMFIILGAVLLLMPTTSLYIILNVISVAMIIGGILSLIKYFTLDVKESFYRDDFLTGLIGVALGILIYFRKDIFISIIPILLGIAILFSGFVKLQDAIGSRRIGYQNNMIYIILAIINIIVGILVILNPFATSEILFMIIGAGLIYSGISDLISTVYLSRKINIIYKEFNKNIIDADIKNKE